MSNLPQIAQHQVALRAEEFQKELTTSNHFKMNLAREVEFALQILEANPFIAAAEPESIRNAVKNVALTGLTLNPVLNQAYLVPRRKSGKLIAVLDPSYQGLITKIIDSGVATKVVAQVVHANDQFDFDESTDSMLIPHRKWYAIGKTESGIEIGAYAGIQHTSGEWQYKFLPIHRINQIMEMSESHKAFIKDNSKGSIWITHREEMVKKTAVKYLWKYLPKSDKLEHIGRAIEESNIAHEVTETVHTDAGVTIKPKDTSATITANALKGVKQPISRTDVKKRAAESIPSEPVAAPAPVVKRFDDSVIEEIIQIIDDNFSERTDDNIVGIADTITSYTGLSEEEITAFVSANTKAFPDFETLCRLATHDQIRAVLGRLNTVR